MNTDTTPRVTLGDLLKRARLDAGMEQADLAAKIVLALHVYGIPKSGWLFPSPTGRSMTPSYVGKLMTAALNDVGFDISPHQLRHLFGTNSYAVCHDLRVVQELLGHASPATTAIYTAFSPVIAAETVRGLPSRPPEAA